jgi:hypothetical protein
VGCGVCEDGVQPLARAGGTPAAGLAQPPAQRHVLRRAEGAPRNQRPVPHLLTAPGESAVQPMRGKNAVANRNVRGLTRGDRKRPLNDGQTPNVRVVRVHVGTGYNRGEGNRRASRSGRVSDLSHPKPPTLRFATLFIAVRRSPAPRPPTRCLPCLWRRGRSRLTDTPLSSQGVSITWVRVRVWVWVWVRVTYPMLALPVAPWAFAAH